MKDLGVSKKIISMEIHKDMSAKNYVSLKKAMLKRC